MNEEIVFSCTKKSVFSCMHKKRFYRVRFEFVPAPCSRQVPNEWHRAGERAFAGAWVRGEVRRSFIPQVVPSAPSPPCAGSVPEIELRSSPPLSSVRTRSNSQNGIRLLWHDASSTVTNPSAMCCDASGQRESSENQLAQ